MKERRKCEICQGLKWFPVKPKNYIMLTKNEQVKYVICLYCRSIANQIKNMQSSNKHIQVVEE